MNSLNTDNNYKMSQYILPSSVSLNEQNVITFGSFESIETHFAINNMATVSNLVLNLNADNSITYSYDSLDFSLESTDGVLFYNDSNGGNPIFKNNIGQTVFINADFMNLREMDSSIYNTSLTSKSEKLIGAIGAHIVHDSYPAINNSDIQNLNFSNSNENLISGWDEAKRTTISNEVQSIIQQKLNTSGNSDEKLYWENVIDEFSDIVLTDISGQYTFKQGETLWMLVEIPFLMESLTSVNTSAFSSGVTAQGSTKFLVGLVNNANS